MMEIIKKIYNREQDHYNADPVAIAFLGDSVTHGAFEIINFKDVEGWETVHDYSSAYSSRFREMIHLLYPKSQVTIINAGIAGDNAEKGLARLNKDVLQYKPDLVVVSFGLNDTGTLQKDVYVQRIKEILLKIKATGAEAIFLTENYMCTKESFKLHHSKILSDVAKGCCVTQNEGCLKAYFDAVKEMCAEIGVPVCDIYAAWEAMEKGGVDTTNLLSNFIDHPIRQLHYYTAVKLLETMFTA